MNAQLDLDDYRRSRILARIKRTRGLGTLRTLPKLPWSKPSRPPRPQYQEPKP